MPDVQDHLTEPPNWEIFLRTNLPAGGCPSSERGFFGPLPDFGHASEI